MQTKSVVRHLLVLLGGFIVGSRLIDAVENWRQWHEWAVSDPSAADLYRTNFWIDVVVVIIALGVTGLIYWLLRPNVRGR
jgi:hypothetical protein